MKWAEERGVTISTHPDYMKEFGNVFYEQVKKLIDKNQSQASYFENLEEKDTKLLQEVLEHAYFCHECVEKFHGRNDLLGKVRVLFSYFFKLKFYKSYFLLILKS